MAFISLSIATNQISFFRSDYPNGVSATIVRNRVFEFVQISKSNDITNVAFTTSPFVGFASGEYTNKTITAFIQAYELNGEIITPQVNEYSDSVIVQYIDDITVPGDTTPPVITPKGSTDIVVTAGQFSTSTQFINAYFTITDPESGVNDFGLNPNIDFQTPRARGSVSVFASNNDGYTSTFSFFLTILVLDTTPPTLSLSTTILQFNKSVYPTGVSPTILTNAMLSIATASDNIDPNPTFEFDKNRVQLDDNNSQATYQIRAVDNSGNRSAYQSISVFYFVDIDVGDTIPPLLELTVNVFNFNVSQYPSGVTANQIITLVAQSIIASDNSGSFAIQYNPTIQNITIVPGVGLTDSYSYQVRAIDGDGNTSPYVLFTVNYVNNTAPADITAPIINGLSTQTFLVSDNRTIGYLLTLYTITDSTQPVSFYNMDTSFVFNTVGTFPVTLQAIDGVGNIGTRNITVNVVATLPPPDTTPPTITGANTVTIYIQDSLNTDAFLGLYYAINDPSGISSKTLSPSVNFNFAGTYQTTIIAIDNFGNVASKNITVIILAGANPNIPEEQGNTTLEDIYIGDELMTNKVKLGFTLSDKIDVELDSATLIAPYTSREQPYKPFTQVKFYFKDVVQPLVYYISDDSVTRLSSASPFFQHSIVLVEPTKILERFKCVDMTFTQPIDDSFASYTLLDVINRIHFNNPSRTINDTSKHWDTIDAQLTNLLASIKAPQLQFRSMTIREALDRAFQYINAVTRLKILDDGTRVLSADFFNTLDTLTNLQSVLNISRNQGSEFFAENSELTVENASTEYATVKFPSYGWAGVRSEGTTINSDNYSIQLPFPIYELLSLKLFLKVRIFDVDNNATISDEYKEVDITPYVFEKQVYDGLPTATQQRQLNKELHSNNTLYYSRGDNRIYNLSTIAELLPLSFLNNQRTIDLIISRIFTEAGATSASWSPVKFSDILFQVEYRTLLNSRLRFMRDVKEDFFGTINTNQMENIVDLEALGANARGVINRVGNPDLTVSKMVKNWNDRFRVGQFTEDGFIATDVENAIFNDHIRTSASFTKNYNGLSRFVGVETEMRQIPIPLQTTKSAIHYSQFIIASATLKEDLTNFTTNNLVEEFVDYLKQFTTKNITDTYIVATRSGDFGTLFTMPDGLGVIEVRASGLLNASTQNPTTFSIIPEPEGVIGPFQPIFSFTTTSTILWSSELLTGINPQILNNQQYKIIITRAISDTSNITLRIDYKTKYQFDRYMVNFSTYDAQAQQIARVAAAPDISSVNNSIKIDWKFDDNLSAGFNVERNISNTLLTGQRKVLYTNNIGRFDYFQFEVAKLKSITGSQGKLDFAARFPSVVNADFQETILSSPLMQHKKDNTENFAMTYQMHMVVDDVEQNHIVIGKKMLTKWFKGDTTNDITFKLYISNTETYGRFDNEKAKGTMQSSENAYTITTILTPTSKAIKIDINLNVSNAKSFAIGNTNGDLILGVNVENPYNGQVKDMTTIYLNFTDKRS
jgi:hypothetical protein